MPGFALDVLDELAHPAYPDQPGETGIVVVEVAARGLHPGRVQLTTRRRADTVRAGE
jgi:hypothetical protein